MQSYLFLLFALLTEVSATILLKLSNGWEKWWFGLASILMYAAAGILMGFALKHLNVGLAYTIWSGVGIGLVCILSVIIWNAALDAWAIAGILLILIGTMMITLKSGSMLQ